MDRCGIFVDAGYLYAAGGELCCGTRSRDSMTLDVAAFVEMLENLAQQHSSLPVLRTYWHDGARDHIPTMAHQRVAALPHVKLRLGNLNSRREQKGVDALIYRDLMTLARERAVADALLLSGDEDLREGVRSAQDMGVRVTLLGIPPKKQKYNQSRDLVNEADNLVVLGKEQLSGFFSKVTLPEVATLWRSGEEAVEPAIETPLSVGQAYAREWWKGASTAQKAALVAARPRIPGSLDADLLTTAQKKGVETAVDGVRPALRRAFWEAVVEVSTADSEPGAGDAEPATT